METDFGSHLSAGVCEKDFDGLVAPQIQRAIAFCFELQKLPHCEWFSASPDLADQGANFVLRQDEGGDEGKTQGGIRTLAAGSRLLAQTTHVPLAAGADAIFDTLEQTHAGAGPLIRCLDVC
ncbi:MAG: hypothetical protein IPG33_12680 [Betaproteobacteria bacterium]|nr:hypothetical protein [Betaproteobacteria bacterium]